MGASLRLNFTAGENETLSPWQLSGFPVSNDNDASWVGSSMPVGGLLGAASTGFLADFIGRRCLILVLYFVFSTGWLIIAFAPSLPVLCIGRGVTGFCSAAFGLVGPVFIGEIASPKNCSLLALVAGQLSCGEDYG